MSIVRNHFGCHSAPYQQEFICGCEFEIEAVKSFGETDAYFSIEEDSSLRNNGREFKTPPCDFERALELFNILHKEVKLGQNPFSDRTSIHVHVNVANMTMEQLRQLTLTYALLEPVFFKFVGAERQHSIYCVPLNYTFLPSVYKQDVTGMYHKWHKYTAFNLKPVKELGTVEFRHLYGTNDREVFNKWLTALKDLFYHIRDTNGWDVVDALENSSPETIARLIVPSLCENISGAELYALMKDTQLDVKLSVGGLK